MSSTPSSRVTLRPSSITFDEGASLPAERTYARDYTRNHVLGEGGMGKVFAARDQNLGRRVAIKELRPEVRGRADLDRWLKSRAWQSQDPLNPKESS